MRLRFLDCLLLVCALAACGAPDSTTEPKVIQQTVSRLVLRLAPGAVFAGMQNWLEIEAYGPGGERISSDLATVVSSDPSIAAVVDLEIIPTLDIAGRRTNQLRPTIKLLRSGTATFLVRLGDVSSTVALTVVAVPPPTGALVVDSFSVVEYRPACAWACPYLAYAPLVRLREPSGGAAVEVVGVSFQVPTQSIGLCSGSVWYAPGQSTHLNRIDPYLWSNDLIFVKLDGVPLPDGPAMARIVVRDSKGVLGSIEAVGSIQRMSTVELPAPEPSPVAGWRC